MNKKWMYLGNFGVLAKGEEIEILKNHFTGERAEDLTKFEHITFSKARGMIEEAKQAVIEDEPAEKPKRKRRTKAEMEKESK